MSRISGLRNDMNKRFFYMEQRINKRYIHFLRKQNIKAPLILDMYGLVGIESENKRIISNILSISYFFMLLIF